MTQIMTEIIKPWCRNSNDNNASGNDNNPSAGAMTSSKTLASNNQPGSDSENVTGSSNNLSSQAINERPQSRNILESYVELMRLLIPCERVLLWMVDSVESNTSSSSSHNKGSTSQRTSKTTLKPIAMSASERAVKQFSDKFGPGTAFLDSRLEPYLQDFEVETVTSAGGDSQKSSLKEKEQEKERQAKLQAELQEYQQRLTRLAEVSIENSEIYNVVSDDLSNIDNSTKSQLIQSVLSIPITDKKTSPIGIVQFVNRLDSVSESKDSNIKTSTTSASSQSGKKTESTATNKKDGAATSSESAAGGKSVTIDQNSMSFSPSSKSINKEDFKKRTSQSEKQLTADMKNLMKGATFEQGGGRRFSFVGAPDLQKSGGGTAPATPKSAGAAAAGSSQTSRGDSSQSKSNNTANVGQGPAESNSELFNKIEFQMSASSGADSSETKSKKDGEKDSSDAKGALAVAKTDSSDSASNMKQLFPFFNHCDIQFIQELCGGVLLLGIHIASLAYKLSKRELQNEAIKNLVHMLSSARDIATIMEAIRSKVRDVFGCERAACFLVDEDQRLIWSPASPDCPRGLVIPADRGIVGVVARTGETYLTNNPKSDRFWGGDVEEGFITRNILTVPVLTPIAGTSNSGKKRGILAVVQALNKAGGGFTSSDVEILEILSSEIANHFDRLAFTILNEKAIAFGSSAGANSSGPGGNGWDSSQSEKTTALLSSYYKEQENLLSGSSRNNKDGKSLTSRVTKGDLLSGGGNTLSNLGPLHEQNLQVEENLSGICPIDPFTEWQIEYHSMTEEQGFAFILRGTQSFRSGEEDSPKIQVPMFLKMLKDLKDSYLTGPRFHNWGHALQVFHNGCLFLSVVPVIGHTLENMQAFAFLWSALGHDVGHRGYGNPFEISSESELAILYNDLSVLENHHASLCSRIMIKNGFLQSLQQGQGGGERGKLFRRMVVNAILGTDMSKHGNLLKKLQTLEISDDPELLVTCLVHCADLGAQILPLKTAWNFYLRCTDEFQLQAQREQELSLPVTPFMIGLEDPKVRAFGQIQFVEFVVIPLWAACSTALPTRSMLEAQAQEEEENSSSEQSELILEKSDWMKHVKPTVEIYRFVSKYGKRRDEMSEEELNEAGVV